eukprot:2141912-Rhodomonas_salina.4
MGLVPVALIHDKASPRHCPRAAQRGGQGLRVAGLGACRRASEIRHCESSVSLPVRRGTCLAAALSGNLTGTPLHTAPAAL